MKTFERWTCSDFEAASNELDELWKNRNFCGHMTSFFIEHWTEKSEKLAVQLADMNPGQGDQLQLYHERKAEKKTIDKMLDHFGIATVLEKEATEARKHMVTSRAGNRVPVAVG